METKPKVLVTGVTGFLGSWVLKYLIEEGKYSVRGTVRNVNDQERLAPFKKAFGDQIDQVELVSAELNDEKALAEAVKGCTYVFHVASPLPAVQPKDENEVIVPAVNGVKFVMQAAVASGVKRVILTSSCTNINTYDSTPEVDETTWSTSIIDKLIPYYKSKLLAEKAAWEIYEANKGKIELVAINPAAIIGPPITTKGFFSGDFIKAVLVGAIPEVPFTYYNWTDVRDVARTHINALEGKDGNRYISAGDNYSIAEVAEMIKKDWGKYGYNVTTKQSTEETIFSIKQST
eukprot:CAMPEP_0170519956 /NCGR_PEP_ID=MMETSP0209-20121228/5175_1 /TAXON_ID=665100 ORGANISM="Litonotus pictus, Strain P1" /NCGR_SAMPLE_ID=MMETSP0209 /ASSEMBLY_ACC=CAM_ASM_000301 /LENGTH=289 /DNA_ID=CAMNT_0010805959 /DNA_START=20 /DNA_END=886 /DNA_ORIENTATION=+